MTTAALAERLAEAAGPIVVKEVRQGLRARIFGIFFALLLLGCLVIALIAAAEFDRYSTSRELGPDYFRLFLAGLAVVEFFVIPYTAFRAMAREREDETWVLLALTGLGPRRIVRGKVSSALAQGLLYASACAPFVLFSYYLNGIDLPTVLISLVMAGSWSCLLVCLAVAAATQAHSRVGRALAHFLVLGLLLAGTGAGIGFASVLADEGGRLLQDEVGFRIFCAALVTWCLTSAWVLTEGAASGLALLSENSAKGPRLALLVQVSLGLGVGAASILLSGDPSAHRLGPAIGSVLTSLHLLMAGLFAVSEHDGFPPAFAKTSSWQRPGAVRSFSLLFTLMIVSTAVWVWLIEDKTFRDRELRILLGGPAYVLLYLSFGVVLGRLTPLKRLGEPIATRVGFLLATGLGIGLPMFLSVLAGERANSRAFNVLNPVLGMVRNLENSGWGATTLAVTGAAALLFTFVAFTVLSTRDAERRT